MLTAAYLQHPILGQRLREVSETILNLLSMTLFEQISPNDIFAQVLDKYFDGQRDSKFIKII